MPGNDTVLHEIDARGVASVTLNRPAVGNAYNGALIDGLIGTFARPPQLDLVQQGLYRTAGEATRGLVDQPAVPNFIVGRGNYDLARQHHPRQH